MRKLLMIYKLRWVLVCVGDSEKTNKFKHVVESNLSSLERMKVISTKFEYVNEVLHDVKEKL